MENKCFLVVPQMIDMWMKKEYVSREILGVEYETVSCIGVGYADQDPKARPRKDLTDVII